jgi:glyoxylase-like metal-dependent hydrolase (beta-lactamase superfamily II)
MKTIFKLLMACLLLTSRAFAQMPPVVPIWDANKVTLGLHKVANDIYAIVPTTAEAETTKGIPQATTGGFVVGDKGVLLIEVMMTQRLYDQEVQLIRSVTDKPIIYAINTSDHGDHCFSNYLLPLSTRIIQNEFARDNLTKNYDGIKQFMVGLFGSGRGIENTVFRPADIVVPKNSNLKVDMGNGKIVELLNISPAQSQADLFVWMPNQKVLWAGNPFIAERPAIPWLFDGVFLEPVVNLKKVYDFLPDDAIVIPGHGRITNKAGIKYTIDYVEELKKEVETAVNNGLSLEQTKAIVTMKEYDKGYVLFHWLHDNYNLPNAYKDISANKHQ